MFVIDEDDLTEEKNTKNLKSINNEENIKIGFIFQLVIFYLKLIY